MRGGKTGNEIREETSRDSLITGTNELPYRLKTVLKTRYDNFFHSFLDIRVGI